MSAAFVHLLILVIAANSTPVLLARCMGDTLAHPIDFGRNFIDGRPLLGKSKTWRGLLVAVIVCAVIAPVMGYPFQIGAYAGARAMLGDMLSSFTKRRLGLDASAQALFIDQIPESLLPALLLKPAFDLSWLEVGLLAASFTVLCVVFSKLFFRLGIRRKPY